MALAFFSMQKLFNSHIYVYYKIFSLFQSSISNYNSANIKKIVPHWSTKENNAQLLHKPIFLWQYSMQLNKQIQVETMDGKVKLFIIFVYISWHVGLYAGFSICYRFNSLVVYFLLQKWKKWNIETSPHFSPMFHFYTPFSGGIEMKHWAKMGYLKAKERQFWQYQSPIYLNQ